MKVAIFFGSKSDTDVMKGAANALKEFGVDYKAYILSAHRVPEKLAETIEKIEKDGCEVIIAGAGLAAHLPGVIASQTTLPVATVGINNSYNAGMLAVQILSLKYPEIKEKLVDFRMNMKRKFIEENGEGVEL